MKFQLILALALLIGLAGAVEIKPSQINWSQSLPSGDGIIFSGTAPGTTTNTLYSDSGTLKFNGTAVGATSLTDNITANNYYIRDLAGLGLRSGGIIGPYSGGVVTPALKIFANKTIWQDYTGNCSMQSEHLVGNASMAFYTTAKYNQAEPSDGGQINHMSAYVQNANTRPVVGIFSMGLNTGAGQVWGMNPVAYTSGAGTAIATEINYGKLTGGSSGSAYGIVLASAGDLAPNAAIQLQSNNDNSIPTWGIYFNAYSRAVASKAAIMLPDMVGAISIGEYSTPTRCIHVVAGSTTDPIADAWNTHCLAIYKDILGPANTTEAVEILKNTSVIQYKRKNPQNSTNPKFNHTLYGITAESAPDFVKTYDSTGELDGIDQTAYIGWLHAVVFNQQQQIDDLERRLAALEN